MVYPEEGDSEENEVRERLVARRGDRREQHSHCDQVLGREEHRCYTSQPPVYGKVRV